MVSAALQIADDSQSHFGFDQLEKLERGEPVLVCPDVETAEAIASQNIPAVGCDGVWTLELGGYLGGLSPTFVFCSDDYKAIVSRAVDGSCVLYSLDRAYKDLGAFLRAGDDLSELYHSAYQAKYYDHREEDLNKQTRRVVPITLASLMNKTFPPLKWIVDGIIPEGLTLLAGPSKLGKSWLSLDIALGVSFGSSVMSGVSVKQGDVLYWALEDSQRRIQDRTKKLIPTGADWNDSQLRIETTANLPPPLDQGGLEMIEDWYDTAANPRLIIIDVYAKVSPQKKGGESEYDAIYRGLKDLHRFASERKISVLVIHHTVKGGRSGDPFDKVNGTRAFTALPDATLVMDFDPAGFADAILYGRGRDLMEFDKALDFDDCKWSVLGETESLKRSGERNAILDLLKDAPADGYSPTDIETVTGQSNGSIRRLLGKMIKAGEVRKLGRGRYALPKQHH